MRGVLPFVSLMKDIKFEIGIQPETPKFLCGVFFKAFMMYKDNQKVLSFAVAPQMKPLTKHIVMKYHHFRIFPKKNTWTSIILTPRNILQIFYKAFIS